MNCVSVFVFFSFFAVNRFANRKFANCCSGHGSLSFTLRSVITIHSVQFSQFTMHSRRIRRFHSFTYTHRVHLRCEEDAFRRSCCWRFYYEFYLFFSRKVRAFDFLSRSKIGSDSVSALRKKKKRKIAYESHKQKNKNLT